MTPLDESDFDRLVREAMQTAPEHPPIANLAARAIQRAEILETSGLASDAVRLARYSLIHQVLTALTAAAVIALALFTVERLSPVSALGASETPSPATGAVNDTLDFFQVLQSEQMAVTAIGMVLVLSLFLAAHLVLSAQPPAAIRREGRTGVLGSCGTGPA